MTGEVVPFTGGRPPERRETGVISRVRKIQRPVRVPAIPTVSKTVDRPRDQFRNRGVSEPPKGYVIKFRLRFWGGDVVYSYAALRVGDRWFTTGATCPPGGYRWRELCAFVDEQELIGMPTLWDGR